MASVLQMVNKAHTKMYRPGTPRVNIGKKSYQELKMNSFLDMLKTHDIDTLKADALSLESQWPQHASDAYKLLAERSDSASCREKYQCKHQHFYQKAQTIQQAESGISLT